MKLVSSLLLLLGATSVPSVVFAASHHQQHGGIQQVAVLPSSTDRVRNRKNIAFVDDDHKKQSPASSSSTLRGGAALVGNQDAIVGAVILTMIERGVNKAFKAYDIDFPSMLGGCGVLLTSLLLADVVQPGLGEKIFQTLNPGAALLAKWLPVFFVPGLAMLPLAPSVGSGFEVRRSILSFYLCLGVYG